MHCKLCCSKKRILLPFHDPVCGRVGGQHFSHLPILNLLYAPKSKDFGIRDLVTNRTFGRKISDDSFGAFLVVLTSICLVKPLGGHIGEIDLVFTRYF